MLSDCEFSGPSMTPAFVTNALPALLTRRGLYPAELASGLLRVSEVFGEDLHDSTSFRATVTDHLASLFAHGARETVRRLTRGQAMTD